MQFFPPCMATVRVNVTAGGTLMNEEVMKKAQQRPHVMTGSIG